MPRRWTLHGLNNGVDLQRDMYRGVRWLPRGGVVCDRRRRHVAGVAADAATAARRSPTTCARCFRTRLDRGARAPGAATRCAPTRATYRLPSRAVARRRTRAALFDLRARGSTRCSTAARRRPRHHLVTGHYGNWELGSVLMQRSVQAAADDRRHGRGERGRQPLRREIRDRLGADTIEVRQSLDTALQIRRRLAENRSWRC